MHADLGACHAERSEASRHLAGAKKKKMQGFFTSLRFVQNDRRPVLCTDLWRCVLEDEEP
jgi:hypothetical protein